MSTQPLEEKSADLESTFVTKKELKDEGDRINNKINAMQNIINKQNLNTFNLTEIKEQLTTIQQNYDIMITEKESLLEEIKFLKLSIAEKSLAEQSLLLKGKKDDKDLENLQKNFSDLCNQHIQLQQEFNEFKTIFTGSTEEHTKNRRSRSFHLFRSPSSTTIQVLKRPNIKEDIYNSLLEKLNSHFKKKKVSFVENPGSIEVILYLIFSISERVQDHIWDELRAYTSKILVLIILRESDNKQAIGTTTIPKKEFEHIQILYDTQGKFFTPDIEYSFKKLEQILNKYLQNV